MAVCTWCDQEMTSAGSCTVSALHRDGAAVGMVPYGDEPGWGASSRCGDCGVGPGGFHHLGCDIQCCPVCAGQMISCGCHFDEDGNGRDDGDDGRDDLLRDSNGDPIEVRIVGGQEVVVHDSDVPESDSTVVDGIPCTTALRTVIDIGPDVDRSELDEIVEDCLDRGLFTLDEASVRLAAPDMRTRPGAVLLREVLAQRWGAGG